MDSQVFITGATGYVGGAIARHLLEAGTTVTNLSRSPTAEFPSIAVDLSQEAPKLEVKDGAGSVMIHCAASMNTSDFPELWGANVVGAGNLLSWAAGSGIGHVVLVSTGGVYPYRDGHAWEEDEATDPIGYYGHTKYLGEEIARMHHRIAGLKVTVLRLFFPFDSEGIGGLGRMMTRRLAGGVPFDIRPGGKPTMNPIHLGDFVGLADKVIAAGPPDSGYEIFNAGGADEVTFLDMCHYFENITAHEAKIRRIDEAQEDLLGSIAKARRVFGWEPEFRFNT